MDLYGGALTWISSDYEFNLTKVGAPWFNESIQLSSSHFSFGINYVYLEYKQDNYQTERFQFQILIQQIEQVVFKEWPQIVFLPDNIQRIYAIT